MEKGEEEMDFIEAKTIEFTVACRRGVKHVAYMYGLNDKHIDCRVPGT